MIVDNIVNDLMIIFCYYFQCLCGFFFIIFKDMKVYNGIGMIGVSLGYCNVFQYQIVKILIIINWIIIQLVNIVWQCKIVVQGKRLLNMCRSYCLFFGFIKIRGSGI